jgi:CRP-like cAMP-binding protein
MASLDMFRHADNLRTYAAGEVIFKAGDTGDEMLCIVEGTAQVFVGGHLLMSLQPGEIVGEMALVDDDHVRTADVRALSEVKVAPVDRRHFEFLICNHPNFGHEVMKTMADRLRKMNEYAAQH